MPQRIEMVGHRYSMLRVIADTDADGNLLGTPAARRVLAACDCGIERVLLARSIRRGNTTSCGCVQRLSASTHGASSHRLYSVYRGMISRCHNPGSVNYHDYGGRGIRVCGGWREDPNNFIAWATSTGWKEGLQLDRKDNSGTYSPQNCQWVTPSRNSRNKRSTFFVEIDGEKLSIQDAAEISGLPVEAIRQRISKLGWSHERAVSEPLRPLGSWCKDE